MMSQKLVEFLGKDENWMRITEPAQLKENIMNHIDRNIYKRLFFLKAFKYASMSFFSLSLVLSVFILVNGLKPMKVVFIYPHSDNVENVEVVGNFNKKHEKVTMKLDESRTVWTGEIKTRKKDVDDYVINVLESDTNDDNPPTDDSDGIGI